MAHPQIAVFARLADGAAEPVRKIEGQKTLLGRTTHSIAYDPIHDEFTVPQPFSQAILTFRGAANGEEAPIRVIQGPLTQIKDSNQLAVDPIHNEIFIPETDAVLTFPREANGNVAPIRILKGPANAPLVTARALAVDPVRNLLVVRASAADGQQRLFIFNRTDEGNTVPRAVIGGPKSGFKNVDGAFAIYPPKGWIVVGIGGGIGDQARSSEESFVGVWNTQDNGDVPPRWKIGGPHGVFKMPKGTALDPKNKTLIVSDKRLNAVMTFYFPELF